MPSSLDAFYERLLAEGMTTRQIDLLCASILKDVFEGRLDHIVDPLLVKEQSRITTNDENSL